MIAQWEPADWAQVYSVWVGWNRLQETLQLQIEGDLLPPEAASRLGFPAEVSDFPSPAYACLWPRMRTAVDPKTRDELDRTTVPEYCSRLGSPQFLFKGAYGDIMSAISSLLYQFFS